MSLADDLLNVAYLESEVRRLRDRAFEEESDAHKHRAKADDLELEIVERRTAANILRERNGPVFEPSAGAEPAEKGARDESR